MMNTIQPELISREAFAPFGEVVAVDDISPVVINDGFALRYDEVMTPVCDQDNAFAVRIFAARKRSFPMVVDMMEKHPLGSQAFIPMQRTTFLCFVAPVGDRPDLQQAKAFIIPPNTGINLQQGIWHFPLMSTEDMQFLVIDRKQPENNLVVADMLHHNIQISYTPLQGT